MKNANQWKIANYISTDVLIHEGSPKCIIAKTKNKVRKENVSVNEGESHYYMLHWLDDDKLKTQDKFEDVLNQAVEAWSLKTAA